DDFYLPHLSAMENDTNQRNLMAKRMGKGGWHIQIDSDEYFINFKKCVTELLSIYACSTGEEKPISVSVFSIPLIKKLHSGFLYVDFQNKIGETFPFATTKPTYIRARLSGHFNIYLSEFAIHETW